MIQRIMMMNVKNFPENDTDFGYQFYKYVELIDDKTRKLEIAGFAK